MFLKSSQSLGHNLNIAAADEYVLSSVIILGCPGRSSAATLVHLRTSAMLPLPVTAPVKMAQQKVGSSTEVEPQLKYSSISWTLRDGDRATRASAASADA